MRACMLKDSWGLENLSIVDDLPDLEPGPGQVRVAMRAAALNFRDYMAVRGRYNPRYPIPLIPGSDGAGVVTALGAGVRQWKVGQRVSPIISQVWQSGPPDRETLKHTLGGPLPGTLQEAMIVPEDALVAVPEHLSDSEAAAVQCAGLTAWNALVTYGQLRAGKTVLIQGTSAVSLFALQFAVLLGARTILTSGDPEKLERGRELGVDETINYKEQPEWQRVARDLTDGRGADHIIEIGGAGTLERSLQAARPGGTVSLIGVMGPGRELDPSILLPAIMRNLRLQGIFVGARQDYQAMNRAIAANQLRPIIDRSFALEEAPDAIRQQGEGERFGKLVVEIEAG
ncbi:MAG: NAD(P)-dependent alcohol dehydrogenase [bacterium]|nr:NAD(P)-dependent alcohol dehydrogenase [bacterium]